MLKMMDTGADVVGPVNLGNPEEFSMRELAEIVLDLTGSRSKVVHLLQHRSRRRHVRRPARRKDALLHALRRHDRRHQFNPHPSGHPPHEIYNLAAQSHVQVRFETPQYTANADALGTLRLLEAIRILRLEGSRFYRRLPRSFTER